MSTDKPAETLEGAISSFLENFDSMRGLICKGQYSKYDQTHHEGAFDDIVRCLLSGYLEVKHGEKTVRCIKPTCVEIYYHEEEKIEIPEKKVTADAEELEAALQPYRQIADDIEKSLTAMYGQTEIPENGLVHDFIVYHRNKPFQDKDVPLYEHPGVLNNHQSGIDIVFESRQKVYGKDINVRASALIRGFISLVKEPSADSSHVKPEDRSTYIYDELYPFAPVFGEGLQIIWKDVNESKDDNGSKNNQKPLEIQAIARKNVFQYRADEAWIEELVTKEKKNRRKGLDFAVKKEIRKTSGNRPVYKPDERRLRFYNKAYYDDNSPQ